MTIEAWTYDKFKEKAFNSSLILTSGLGTAVTEVLIASNIDSLFSYDDRIISAGIHYMGKRDNMKKIYNSGKLQ